MAGTRQTNGIDKVIGARMRQRRLALDMSQERLAEQLSITFQQVQKYEKGVNRVSASRLFEIAAALETPVAVFYEGLDGAISKTYQHKLAAEEVLATPEGQKLIALFASIENPKVRKRILELAMAVAADA